MGSRTDGLTMRFFYLIVDVAFFFNQERSHFVRGKLANWALQERALLVSLFKCLKWIFRSTFP